MLVTAVTAVGCGACPADTHGLHRGRCTRGDGRVAGETSHAQDPEAAVAPADDGGPVHDGAVIGDAATSGDRVRDGAPLDVPPVVHCDAAGSADIGQPPVDAGWSDASAPGPDYVVEWVGVPSILPRPGWVFDADLVVQNRGEQSGGAAILAVFLGAGADDPVSAFRLTTAPVASLAAMGQSALRLPIVTPRIPPGEYSAWGVVDAYDEVAETNEGNNATAMVRVTVRW